MNVLLTFVHASVELHDQWSFKAAAGGEGPDAWMYCKWIQLTAAGPLASFPA